MSRSLSGTSEEPSILPPEYLVAVATRSLEVEHKYTQYKWRMSQMRLLKSPSGASK